MNYRSNKSLLILAGLMAMGLSACKDNDPDVSGQGYVEDAEYVGKSVGNFSADEWYPGGKLGTTDNVTAGCYEDETPVVVDNEKLELAFKLGEAVFERNFTDNTEPFKGLGPAYLRSSCIDCHPGYGHGKRQTSYPSTYGNGYLLAIYHPTSEGSNDGAYISEVTGMPQTLANAPFLPPVDGSQIRIEWKHVTAMESGLPMKFPDGETYDLIYPEVTIPESAFNTNPKPTNYAVRLESTIGVIGTGLIDAIPQDSIIAQYKKEAAVGVELNPSFWDKGANDMAASAWYKFTVPGTDSKGQPVEKMLKRFTYALTRASLQDGPGANAVWNITNVTRSDRPYLYTTNAWAKAMSENESVLKAIMADPTSPYYGDGSRDSVQHMVYNLLRPGTNQFDNPWHKFQAEMSDDQFYNFMVWHRGLSIPRARDLNDTDVQRGKELFISMGCAHCHRPQWTTGDDNYWSPNNISLKPLPKYPHQKIYPYSDFVQHKLCMKNDIHGSWCRTTPLWGRGLSLANTGAEDRLHDCRARNEVEAIMWHGYSKNSQAYFAAAKFYKLSKKDRDCVVKFLRAI